MLVLAAVPDVQFHKLRRSAGGRFSVVQTTTWDDVLTAIRGRPVELAVVAPLPPGHARSHEIGRLRVLFPSPPLILSTTLPPRTAALASGGRHASGCRHPGTSPQAVACCTRIGCCRAPGLRSRTCRGGSGARGRYRFSCTLAPTSCSPPARCGCPSFRRTRWPAWC